MRHVPTGLSVFINGRDQVTNRRKAKQILTTRVNEMRRAAQYGEYNARRKILGNSGRSDKVRTYNYLKGRAVHHATGRKTSDLKAIFDKGRFDLLIR